MAHLIVRGGSIATQGGYFPAGVYEISNAQLIAELEGAVRDLPWAAIEYDYDEPRQLTTGEPEPAQPALDTPGQKLIAETHDGDSQKGAAGKIEDALAPEVQKPAPGFACPYCDRLLRNEGARISHVKTKHEDRAEEFLAARRAAKAAGEHGWGDNAPEE